MEKIRKGNDIKVQWAIYAGCGINEAPYDLTGRNLTLYMKNQFSRFEVYDFTIEKHIITFMFWGKEQQHTGVYSIELVENEGREGMHTVDECDAFQIVSHSCETGGDSEGRVECIHLQFRANMGVSVPVIGAGLEVDSQLSLESENPVQNKVITATLQRMEQSLDLAEDSVQSLSRKVDGIHNRMNTVEAKTEVALIKVESFDGMMTTIENSTSNALTKVEEMETKINTLESKVEEMDERIDTLHADASTEGSVDNKIANALGWEEIE
jgi:archaellum component FlaC